jgi:hypothetical protein
MHTSAAPRQHISVPPRQEYPDTSSCTLAQGCEETRAGEASSGMRVAVPAPRQPACVWTNGEGEEYVPRHAEVNERLARAILRKACKERI